jgi:peptidoglycan/xylan/chitin deacetylase (PgdA/CDA1 family)
MFGAGTLYLMYHELELPGRELCQREEGYTRYVLLERDFRDQLTILKAGGVAGISVGQALRREESGASVMALTFDDGSETDLIMAAPALREVGFHATFYLVTGFLGRKGYLSQPQARELAEQGFEVGCHSMSHRYLPDLTAPELRREVSDAKTELEQILGRRVEHFSCPGGRWNRRVAEMAREAGYISVATSRIGTNTASADRFRLARVTVMRKTSAHEFSRLCRREGLLSLRVRQAILTAVQSVLGNAVYDKIRAALLHRQ